MNEPSPGPDPGAPTSSALLARAARALREDLALGLLFLAVQAFALANALRHDPAVAYDAGAHAAYGRALARLALPAPADTYEFFNPPLSYVVPAAALRAGASPHVAAKVAQLAAVLYSAGLCLVLLATCELVWPGARWPRRVTLLLLGMLPVYYRTLAFVRPEPLLTLLWALAVLLALEVFAGGRSRGVALGVCLGLLLLTRQQAAFLGVSIALVAVCRLLARRSRLVEWRPLVMAAAVSIAVGGWFYLRNTLVHGSPAAYATKPVAFSLSNQPPHFYLAPGWRDLFREPIRPFLRNQFLPTLYAETWGDHGAYFLIRALDRRTGKLLYGGAMDEYVPSRRDRRWLVTNRGDAARYLARVNAVSLLPSALALAGLGLGLAGLLGRDRSAGERARTLLALPAASVAVTLAAFVLLMLVYPGHTGHYIKATYVLPVYPMLALLGAGAFEALRERAPRGSMVLAVALLAVFVHNSRAYLTAFPGPWRTPVAAEARTED